MGGNERDMTLNAKWDPGPGLRLEKGCQETAGEPKGTSLLMSVLPPVHGCVRC